MLLSETLHAFCIFYKVAWSSRGHVQGERGGAEKRGEKAIKKQTRWAAQRGKATACWSSAYLLAYVCVCASVCVCMSERVCTKVRVEEDREGWRGAVVGTRS